MSLRSFENKFNGERMTPDNNSPSEMSQGNPCGLHGGVWKCSQARKSPMKNHRGETVGPLGLSGINCRGEARNSAVEVLKGC